MPRPTSTRPRGVYLMLPHRGVTLNSLGGGSIELYPAEATREAGDLRFMPPLERWCGFGKKVWVWGPLASMYASVGYREGVLLRGEMVSVVSSLPVRWGFGVERPSILGSCIERLASPRPPSSLLEGNARYALTRVLSTLFPLRALMTLHLIQIKLLADADCRVPRVLGGVAELERLA